MKSQCLLDTCFGALVSCVTLLACSDLFLLDFTWPNFTTLLKGMFGLSFVLVLCACRLGSHLSPSRTECYITSDMFYVEVHLDKAGKLVDVKVAHHGENPVVRGRLVVIVNRIIKQFVYALWSYFIVIFSHCYVELSWADTAFTVSKLYKGNYIFQQCGICIYAQVNCLLAAKWLKNLFSKWLHPVKHTAQQIVYA